MAKKSEKEPELTISCTRAEMMALVRYHTGIVKKIPKTVGAESMKLMASNPFGSGKEIKALHKAAQDIVSFHTARARGLLSLMDPNWEG